MRRAALLLAVLGLAACSPPPRSASDFKAHPAEMRQVIADCAAGARRGPECDNAQAAQAQIKSDQRLSLYRRSF